MPTPSITIYKNLLGKLLGGDSVQLQASEIRLYKRNLTTTSIGLQDSFTFLSTTKSLFGYSLQLDAGAQSPKLRFIKHKNIEAFVHGVNQLVYKNIEQAINKAHACIQRDVIENYPRDSRLANLKHVLDILATAFPSQDHASRSRFDEDLLRRADLCLSFMPIVPEKLRAHHEKLQLTKRKHFYNKVEAYPLTTEQRLGVIRSNDKNMVLAAAGTGKTSVIVAKALDLIDRKLAAPEQILILAYNRNAALELNERLSATLCVNIQSNSL